VFKKLINISLLLLFPICLSAQTAADYFHRGAQHYIWGEKQKAQVEVVTGLKLFPNDPQLQGLAGLLKKEEKPQQQQENQGQQGQQGEQQQQQQNQPEQKQDRNQQQQQQEQQQQQSPQNQMGQTNEQQQASQAQEAQPDQKKEEEQKDAAAAAAGQMTREQAERLLDSQKGHEKMLSLKQQGKPVTRKIKDW
jgi:hypothetical protein